MHVEVAQLLPRCLRRARHRERGTQTGTGGAPAFDIYKSPEQKGKFTKPGEDWFCFAAMASDARTR